MEYELVEVSEPADWSAYHAIRRQELFEARGRYGIYDPDFAGEFLPGQHPYLLKHHGKPIGTTRLDIRDDASAVFRLVAITASEQGKGHGRVLAQLVAAQARAHGARTALVNAAASAVGYYEKTGWTRHVWDAAELAVRDSDCIQMRKSL